MQDYFVTRLHPYFPFDLLANLDIAFSNLTDEVQFELENKFNDMNEAEICGVVSTILISPYWFVKVITDLIPENLCENDEKIIDKISIENAKFLTLN